MIKIVLNITFIWDQEGDGPEAIPNAGLALATSQQADVQMGP